MMYYFNQHSGQAGNVVVVVGNLCLGESAHFKGLKMCFHHLQLNSFPGVFGHKINDAGIYGDQKG